LTPKIGIARVDCCGPSDPAASATDDLSGAPQASETYAAVAPASNPLRVTQDTWAIWP
jgi:hypothetical protein